MGRYARLALAEREEIVLLRRGGLRRDGRSGGRRRSVYFVKSVFRV